MKNLAVVLGLAVAKAHGGCKGKSCGVEAYAPAPVFTMPRPVIPIISAPLPPPAPIEIEKTISDPECPEGFNFDGELCVQPIFAEMEPICPVGQLEGGMCVVHSPYLHSCPEPYTKGIGGCSKTLQAERTPFCPDGFTPAASSCEQINPAAVVPVCHQGILENEVCVVRTHQSPIIDHYCPEGYMEEAGGCYRTETYDCTPTAFVPAGKKHGKHGHHGGYGGYAAPVYDLQEVPCAGGNLRVTYKGGKKTKECHKTKPMPVAVDVIARTCQKKVSTPWLITRTCPPGTIDDGFVCIAETTIPPVPECTAEGSAQNCYTRITVPYQYECPLGMNDNGHMCVSIETVPLEPYCPIGTTDIGTGCAAHSPPDHICPRPFRQQNGRCMDELFEEPRYTICTTCVGRQCIHRPQVPTKTKYHHGHQKVYANKYHGHQHH